MSELSAILTAYGQLEIEVGQCMQHACGPFCGQCEAICCRSVFCRESLESPFLGAVRKRYSPEASWNEAQGWLTPSGCSLSAGRPPVCYEFLCRPLVEARPAGPARTSLVALARVMTDAGKNAAGRRHIVELDNLQKINSGRVIRQLDRAKSVLDGLRTGLHACAG